MPLLRLETSAALPEDRRKALLASLSKAVAETIGKPEQYVMVAASQAVMLMSGKPGDGAFVDLRSIGGLSDEVNRKLSQQVCKLLKDYPFFRMKQAVAAVPGEMSAVGIQVKSKFHVELIGLIT